MNNEEFLDEDALIEMTDAEGNVYYYIEDMTLQVDGANYAFLVELPNDDEHEHNHNHEHGEGCDCGCEDGNVIIAKVIVNADGEEEYIEPTDEEFEQVLAAYDELVDAAE